MAEGRFISRNIAFSEQLGQISMEADYLFMRMLPHLDCEGRITGSPTSIRARVCPLRKEMNDGMVSLSIAELDQNRLIVWYEVDGMQCIEYPNFEKYQTGLRKNREAPSKIPASASLGAIRLRTILPIQAPVTDNSGTIPDNSGSPPAQIKERKEKLREVKEREVKFSAPSDAELNTKSSGAKYPNYPTDICDQLFTAYQQHRGPVEYGVFRRYTSVIFPTSYTTDQLTSAIQAWGEWVAALPAEKAKHETARTWAADVQRWVRLGSMPIVDLNGVTERGRLAAGGY